MKSSADSFEHRQTAHCESGVVAALLREQNAPLSEAMIFGVAAGLSFAYLPFLTMGGQPLLSYRMPPRSIIKGVKKRLGVKMRSETFSSVDAGMRALDDRLVEGKVVGLQTSVYWLPYFPPDMRFHFNAHNLVVYGKKGDNYLISDPVLEQAVECDTESLARARFVRGALAPKGLIYYPESVPQEYPLDKAVLDSIRFTTGMMLHTPLPIIGIRGIRFVARRIRGLDRAHHSRNRHFLGHIVRMQEEIGTGGAGFRFLYSAFLQESSKLLGVSLLSDIANDLTSAGDAWRQFALLSARMCKEREEVDYGRLADLMEISAKKEQAVFKRLRSELPAAIKKRAA